jgi:hypothetical protein
VDLSLGAKRIVLEADHSPPSNAYVNNGGVISPHTICRHGVVINYLSMWSTLAFPLLTDGNNNMQFTESLKLKTKLRGLSPRANYTDQATAS